MTCNKYELYFDKNIARMKVVKNCKTASEIEEIEQASILHIRSISEELFSLMNQIDDFQPSMLTPTASPINRKPKSGHNSRTQSEEEDLIAFSFLKNKQQPIKPKGSPPQPHKRGSVPSIHYAGYMKPTHHIKQKIRQILLSEREQKLVAEEKERKRIEQLKKMSNKNYSGVESRYQRYDEQKGDKTEAIANRMLERELLQMSEVTFKPKINTNVPINQSFDERLQYSKYRKQVKEGQIIKDMIKGHTYQPKINSHKHSESKIKKIWSQSPSGHKEKLYKTQQLSKSIHSQSPSNNEERHSRLRTTVADLDFVINESLFTK